MLGRSLRSRPVPMIINIPVLTDKHNKIAWLMTRAIIESVKPSYYLAPKRFWRAVSYSMLDPAYSKGTPWSDVRLVQPAGAHLGAGQPAGISPYLRLGPKI